MAFKTKASPLWAVGDDFGPNQINDIAYDLRNIGEDTNHGGNGIYNIGVIGVVAQALPSMPLEGYLVYDIADHKLKFYNGASWQAAVSPSAGLWLAGSGAPAGSTGNNGDMYLNVSTGDVYGPKTSGAWGAIRMNINGPAGPAGPQGIGYNPRGAYSAGTTYAQGDMVAYGGLNYTSLRSANTGNQPDTSPDWWQPMVVTSSNPAEVPTGALNGTNKAFVFSSTPRQVIYNGITLRETVDYTVSGTTATLTAIQPAPDAANNDAIWGYV